MSVSLLIEETESEVRLILSIESVLIEVKPEKLQKVNFPPNIIILC